MSVVYIKMTPVITHMFKVKGFVNIHADPVGFAGTIIAKPGSTNGVVKSTYCNRSAVMVKSPMAASKVLCCI
nr:hypothetical protein CFP56_24133 [Quercus suber]